ncbi:MAG: MFS transporter [Streptosporangiaceae bacterium]
MTSARPLARQPDPAAGSRPAARRAAFRTVFAVRGFRALWASQVLSALGDRLALVALALLVYDRTRSPLLGAVAYAAGTVPYLAGSLFLAGAADRFARREVMVLCDVSRAALVAVMLVPRMPIGVLVAILYVVTTIQPVFDSARGAVLPDMVDGERYALAVVVIQTSFRIAAVAGAAAAGLLVALLGARPALGADAATFAVSALLIRFGTSARPAADRRPGQRQMTRLVDGARLVFGDPALRTLVLLGWLAAAYAVPAGVAGPYAASIGGGPAAAGLLIAASPAGAVLAAPVFTRMAGPAARLRWMGPMAICGCAALTLVAIGPGLAASIAIIAVSGSFATYQVAANTAFVARLPDQYRAQAFGLAAAGVVGGQGVAFLAAGAVAQVISPSAVIAASGALGALAAFGLAITWQRDQRHADATPAAMGR